MNRVGSRAALAISWFWCCQIFWQEPRCSR